MSEKAYCSCHNLSAEDFQAACSQGANSVRACFCRLECKPKCAECIPLVKAILEANGQHEPRPDNDPLSI
jgi:NAD(P)H-nitrite reductase large subunit